MKAKMNKILDSEENRKETRGRPLGRNLDATISLRLPGQMIDRLDEVSKSKGLDRANMIRLAISEYLDRNEK